MEVGGAARQRSVGVLALQGSFHEHIAALRRVGVSGVEVRKAEHLEKLGSLIIPGGESTTMAKLAHYHNLFPALREFVKSGRPVWGTCAGLIFLADRAIGQKNGGQEFIGGLDCTVHRNFFGSQLQSFEIDLPVSKLAAKEGGPASFRGVFIRAPAIMEVGPNVEVLADYTVHVRQPDWRPLPAIQLIKTAIPIGLSTSSEAIFRDFRGNNFVSESCRCRPANREVRGPISRMDLGGVEEQQEQTLVSILQDSIAIPRSSPRTFSLITLVLIFPLSFAILAHTLFTHPILLQLESEQSSSSSDSQKWMLLFLYQFVYLILLFIFSLLSTAAVVFTVASLYSSKPISFSSTLSAIPPVFSRLMHTFAWVSAIMALYHLAFALVIFVLLLAVYKSAAFIILASFVVLGFVVIHIYIACVWHLASVVTVLEPIHGLGAMNKSMELLKGKTRMAAGLVLGYLAVCAVISLIFRAVVVQGGEGGIEIGAGIVVKVVVGGVLVAALVVINLIGLLVQSVFYYVCKSFHHENIDKTALCDHLGGYLGEYVPLKSSIQMETL